MDAELEVDGKHHIKPVRQEDRSIIDVTIEKGHRGKTLESINGVRKYLNLIHLSDLVHCDGKTLSDELLEASGQMATNITFPKEKPTRNEKSLWMEFLGTLTDGHETLLQPFGDYISLPHTKLHWQHDKGSKIFLCFNHDSTEHDAYAPQTCDSRMRSGPVYKRAGTVTDPTEGINYAPVTFHGDNMVKFHSRVSTYVE